jgi:hypothetical protein
MLSRCYKPSNASYQNYGGRGIKVHERWHSFDNFLEDMGVRLEGKTLERERVNEDYSPGNCKWATKEEQYRNKRSNVFFEGKTLAEWSRELGISDVAVGNRLRKWGTVHKLT